MTNLFFIHFSALISFICVFGCVCVRGCQVVVTSGSAVRQTNKAV